MSKREEVLDAVLAMVRAALPDAVVERNIVKAETVGPGGEVNILDGDPGDPEVDLSPLTYNYEHRIDLEFRAYESASLTREQVLDLMMGAVGAAVRADRFLGGLCDWLEPAAPDSADVDTQGALPVRAAAVPLLASYSTSDPLN